MLKVVFLRCIIERENETKMNETEYSKLSTQEKRIDLYLKQKNMLKSFLERKAISKEQYDKSLNDLTEKMGM